MKGYKKMDSEKLIQQFLHGQLDEAQQKQLADLIENDPEFAAELEIESTLYAKRSLALKGKIAQATINTKNQNNNPRSTKLIKFISSIAAALLICVFSYFAITKSDLSSTQNQLVETYLSQKHTSPVTLMGSDETKDNWSTAIEAYKKDDYLKVVEIVKSLDSPTDEQILYSAISKLYLSTPDTTGAIQALKSIVSRPGSLVEDQANWYLALGYLYLEDETSAKPILQSIVQGRFWKHENASQLLNSMK